MKNINTKVTLNNGVEMPIFGLGAYATKPGDEAYNSVRWALDTGYRLVDTAAYYENEADIGRALADSGMGREKYFITTKIWPADFNDAQNAFEKSLRLLKLDYVDLYLMHWPGTDRDAMLRTWDFMLAQSQKGIIKACGVSNFYISHMQAITDNTGVAPANNQIELHPWQQQREIRAYCKANNISVTSWGPIFHGYLNEEPLMAEIGRKHGKTAAQATLRWHVQNDINLIPKSVKKERIIENSDIFDFELDAEDMERINALDGGRRFAFDANTYSGMNTEEEKRKRDEQNALRMKK